MEYIWCIVWHRLKHADFLQPVFNLGIGSFFLIAVVCKLLNGKLHIEIDGIGVIGPGKIELLEKIKKLGSIRQAAIKMGMYYRQAWQLMEQWTRIVGEPAVPQPGFWYSQQTATAFWQTDK